MIRPLLVLATVLLTILGAAAGADAAELLAPVLAQSPNIVRGPGLLPESLQVHPRGR